ncbi:MAG: hypothetical protein IJX20_00080 [Alphaproteobacteria bacterium]|nr:hypothetical protein [Alphaproteobacteria bacterium]
MTEFLPTQNKNWGFWGIASSYTSKEKMPEIWAATFKIIQKNSGFTPLETLALMDSRWGRHIADEFAEEISCDLEIFTKAFKRKMTKDRLYRDFNYYIDPDAYKPTKATRRYENFAKDLAKLSKTYGIVIKSIGGVSFCSQEDLKNFKGYTTDLESGDLEPVWKED